MGWTYAPGQMSKGGNFKCHCSRFPPTNSEGSLSGPYREKKVDFTKAALAKIKCFKENFSKNKDGANVHPCNSFGGKCPLMHFSCEGKCPGGLLSVHPQCFLETV